MVKKVRIVLVIGLFFVGLCGCVKTTTENIAVTESTATEKLVAKNTLEVEPILGDIAVAEVAERKKVVVDCKNAKDFVDPIIIKNDEETDSFDEDTFQLTNDKEHLLVSVLSDNEPTIRKINLFGEEIWCCWYEQEGDDPEICYVQGIKERSDGIFVLLQHGGELLLQKISHKGKLLYRKNLLAGRDSDIGYESYVFCDDGIAIVGYKKTADEYAEGFCDDFIVRKNVIMKFDFKGKKIWKKYYSLPENGSDELFYLGGNLLSVCITDRGENFNESIRKSPIVLPGEKMKYNEYVSKSKLAHKSAKPYMIIKKFSLNDGYLEWEKKIAEKFKADETIEVFCTEKSLLLAHRPNDIGDKSNKDHSFLRYYEVGKDLVKEIEYAFENNDDHFWWCTFTGDSIWTTACWDENVNDEYIYQPYVFQCSKDGDLIDVYNMKQHDYLVGWTGKRAILYRKFEEEEN